MSSAFEQAWRHAEPIEGWLTADQARLLHRFATRTRAPGWIVEVGSHHGRSTVVLAAGAPHDVALLAIDPFDDPRWGGGEAAFEVFRSNVAGAGLEDKVRSFQGTSEQAADQWSGEPVDLLFVDGAHDVDSVLIDIDRWEPLLGIGAVVCFHDAFSSVGVTWALLRRHLWNRSFRYLQAAGSLVAYRRQEGSSLMAAGSAVSQAARIPWFARNLAVKMTMRRGWDRATHLLGHYEQTYPY